MTRTTQRKGVWLCVTVGESALGAALGRPKKSQNSRTLTSACAGNSNNHGGS